MWAGIIPRRTFWKARCKSSVTGPTIIFCYTELSSGEWNNRPGHSFHSGLCANSQLRYPALGAASKLIAIAHAEHRQVVDQLSVLLKTPQSAPGYEQEWNSFKTVLEAHADEEERDLIPAPPEVKISDAELDELGDKMASRMEQLRGSTLHKLRTKGRAALVRAL
jgi:hypothetical protein